MAKCRTCLQLLDLATSTDITKKSLLGKSIKDLLLIFVPQMNIASLVGNLICLTCMKRIENFTKFIEDYIKVEELLVLEELNKNRKGKAQIQANAVNSVDKNVTSAPLNLIYLVPSVNQKGAQNGVQPLQLQPIPLNYLLTPPAVNSNTTLGNKVVPAGQHPAQAASQSQLLFLPKIQLQGPPSLTNPVVTTNSVLKDSVKQNKTQAQTSLLKNQVIDLTDSAVGNRICRSCGDVFTSDNWKTVECPICVSVGNVENIIDLAFNDISSDDETNDVSDMFTTEPTPKAQVAEVTTRASLLKNLRSEFRDTIISAVRTPEEVDMFLNHLTESGVKIIDYGPSYATENKRILFLGNNSGQCKECKALLKQPRELKLHFVNCHSKISDFDSDSEEEEELGHAKLFICPFCNVELNTPILLVDHLHKMHTIVNPFKCEKCGKQFKKREIYLDHMKRFQDVEDCTMKKCKFCPEMIKKADYFRHLSTHKNIVCEHCGKAFTKVQSFRMHYNTHLDENDKNKQKLQKALCPICGKLLSNKNSMRDHMATHGERLRKYMCHVCPKTFLTKYALTSHLRTAHTDKKYECMICNIKVRTATALNNHHSLKHSMEYTHTCHICGEGFSRGDYFNRHMKRHMGSAGGIGRPGKKKYNYSVNIEYKPVQCKYCLKVFKNVYLLRTHVLSHVKSMRFKCKFCNMTFANPGTKYRHQKRHADPNFDLSCTVCWRRMDNKEELVMHLAKHEESKKYKCTECGELVASKYLMKHHMSEKHIPQEQIEREKATVLSGALQEFLL